MNENISNIIELFPYRRDTSIHEFLYRESLSLVNLENSKVISR